MGSSPAKRGRLVQEPVTLLEPIFEPLDARELRQHLATADVRLLLLEQITEPLP